MTSSVYYRRITGQRELNEIPTALRAPAPRPAPFGPESIPDLIGEGPAWILPVTIGQYQDLDPWEGRE